MKVTIRDIAKQADVSPASVSLVLNDRPCRITAETKNRILKIAQELGYQHKSRKEDPPAKGRRLIGILHPNLKAAAINGFISGVEAYAPIYGYRTLICNCRDSSACCIEYLQTLAASKVDGLIVIPPTDMNSDGNDQKLGEALRKTRLPFVLLDKAINRVFCDFVTSDNKQGAYTAVEHLILNGHEQIGILTGPKEIYNTRKHVEGYKEALAFFNQPIRPEWILYGSYTREAGYEGAASLWEQGIAAMFVCNDDMACGVYQFARERNLKIGEDLSLITFNDQPFFEFLDPPLTSIRQEEELMGKKACEVVIKRITRQDKEEIHNTYFAPVLIERSSVKKLRKREV